LGNDTPADEMRRSVLMIEQPVGRTVAPDADERRLYRWGGISALLLALGYLITIPLFVAVGAPPHGGEARLEYLVGKTTVWWAILGLSVFTDLLFLPVALALYRALRSVNKNAMVFATTLVGLFVVLDLAVTWTNYAALITLSEGYATATAPQRAADVGAATYAAVLDSSLEAIYSILILAIGILVTSLVMRKGVFGRGTAYVGVVTGVGGIVAVVGPYFASVLSVVIVVVSAPTTLWIVLVGVRLIRLSRR
jgi:hypothetical protein